MGSHYQVPVEYFGNNIQGVSNDQCAVSQPIADFPLALQDRAGLCIHSAAKGISFACICGTKFSRQDALKRHIREQSDKARTYLCDICGEGFKRLYHLRQHKNALSKCDRPTSQFAGPANAQLHGQDVTAEYSELNDALQISQSIDGPQIYGQSNTQSYEQNCTHQQPSGLFDAEFKQELSKVLFGEDDVSQLFPLDDASQPTQTETELQRNEELDFSQFLHYDEEDSTSQS
ncbi:hypothetical protein F4805DRAFT_458675 [Annulohypoxylon moriforme]|nr:hypothetical protein F4805DRAFT_458675 [Annulohypoxylon moriforme]